MKKAKLEDVLTEWQNNLEFRENFKKNPVSALKKAGLKLSEEDLKKVRSLLRQKKNKDENLNERINK